MARLARVEVFAPDEIAIVHIMNRKNSFSVPATFSCSFFRVLHFRFLPAFRVLCHLFVFPAAKISSERV